MDGHGEMGLLPENFDLGLIGRIRDDGYESRSGSDNFEGGSGEEPDAGDNPRPRKKKYHRHTPNQIQELESFFKECPHPDEKQRSELSKRLSLENKQVKFWFQNRRTQMKTQLERHENIILRQENDKLRAENNMIKDAISSPMCNQCGGPAIPGQISFEEHQIRIENARLRDELNRICALATKFLGRPLSSMAAPIPLPNPSNGFGSGFCSMPVGLDGLSFAPQSMMKPLFPPPTMLGMNNANEVQFERSMLIDLALAAMDEFMKMAQADSPLWNKDPSRGNGESLNFEEYVRSFPPCIGPKPANFASEATRDTSLVSINSLTHVDSLMDANQWTEMFPCLVARAATVEIISTGMGGTRNGALQVMQAELQVLSPLVPVRAVKFLRFCKQHAEGVWAVVDVSVGTSHDASKRLPSGCLIQDMPDGSSKVIWIEHWEYNESGVHEMFRAFMRSGKGFGSQRWLSTLQRQCESLAATNPHDQIGMVELRENGRRSMVKLAKRMVENFCNGVCATSVRRWEKVNVGGVGEDVRVMTRQSVDDPGEPPGTILSAATSVWVPLSHNRLFQFLSDHRLRSDWDILSNDGPMLHMLHIAKGQRMGNHVSLLRAASKTGTTNDNESAMVILQETWSDASGSMVVYAPVDTPSVDVVLSGGDSAYVALLPSGFAILPDQAPPSSFVKGEADVDNNPDGGPGCLLTVGFQILVSSIPTAKINIESVDTVNNLISCTIHKIKAALHIAT